MAPSTAEVEEILRYKKVLETSVSAEEILEVLILLEAVEVVDRSLLSATKIGLAVAKHKQHENSSVAQKAKKLVEKWRGSVGPPAAQKSPTNNAVDASGSIFDNGNMLDACSHCGDPKRTKAREILHKAFLDGLPPEQLAKTDAKSVARLVCSIEDHLWDLHCSGKNNSREYQSQLRAIKSNFADKKNPEFNVRAYVGALSIEKIATMPSIEMASDAKKAERLKARKEALEACQSDWDLRNVKRAAGQFPCGKCKSLTTTYFQMQTRSSDEPMTTFVNCLNCGNRWKF